MSARIGFGGAALAPEPNPARRVHATDRIGAAHSRTRLTARRRSTEAATTPAVTPRSLHARVSAHEVAAVGAICALALALRLYRIEFQSLWWDEGVSLYLATLPLSGLTTGKDWLVDLHPPLYHLLLGVWTRLAGSTPFAARYLSAWFGVAAVPLTYVLARAMGSRLGAIIGAALVAVSQFAVFYGQESRMYPLVAFLGLLSVWTCARVLRPGARLAGFATVAAVNLVGLYTYYYLGLLIVAEAGVALVMLRRDRRAVARWIGAHAVCALLYAPWLALFLTGANSTATSIPSERVTQWSLASFVFQSLLGFTVGFARPAPWSVLSGVAALAAAGYATVRLGGRSVVWWLVLATSAFSILAAYAIDVARPFLYPRFVIWVQPMLLAAIGVGVGLALSEAAEALRGRVRAPAFGVAAGLVALSAIVLVVHGNYRSLAEHYTVARTAYSSSDYRPVLAGIARAARPGDLVIGTYPWQLGYVVAYVHTPGIRLIYFAGESAEREATQSGSMTGRAWLLLYSADRAWIPDRVESALIRQLPTAYVDQYGDTRARLFGAPDPVVSPLARLGDSVLLTRTELAPSGPLHAGGTLDVTLTWQASAHPAADYTVFVHLLGPDGQLRAQSDGQPVFGAFPTSGWSVGTVYVDRHWLAVPPDAAPGEYTLEAGMYVPSTGQRLPVGRTAEEPDRVILGKVPVVR